jgi:hypothetical protein
MARVKGGRSDKFRVSLAKYGARPPRALRLAPRWYLFGVAQSSSSAVSQTCSLLPCIAYDGLVVANSQCVRQAAECNSAIQQTECLRYMYALTRYSRRPHPGRNSEESKIAYPTRYLLMRVSTSTAQASIPPRRQRTLRNPCPVK